MTRYYKIQEETLNDIASAIREKGIDVPNPLNGSAFASMIRTLPSSEALDELQGLVTGPATDYTYYGETLGASAFAGNRYLRKFTAPNLTTIGTSAFYSTNTTEIVAPKLSVVPNGLSPNNSSLIKVEFETATSIGASAFDSCNNLTEINAPNVTTIGSFALWSCTSLTTLNMPNLATIGSSAFYNCNKLVSVPTENVTYIHTSAFHACSGLGALTLTFNKSVTVANRAFFGAHIEEMRFNNYVNFGADLFSAGWCNKIYCFSNVYFGSAPFSRWSRGLQELHLYGSSKASVYNESSLRYISCPIYVPASLYDSYYNDTKFSYVKSYFVYLPHKLTINNVEYDYADGQTWAEWVNSEYNTLGLITSGNNIEDVNGTPLYNEVGAVLPTNMIRGDICTL